MAAVIVAQPVPTLSPQTEAARKTLNSLGMLLMLAGGFSLISFWAGYYLGFVLSVGSIITGYTQHAHTRDANAMVNCHTVVNARTAFNTIQQMNYVGCILGGIATLLCAYAAYAWSTLWGSWTAYILFAIVGALSALTIAVGAAFSAMKCGEIHREIIVLIPAPGAAPAAAAGGAYVQMPGQAAYGQPAPAPGYAPAPAPAPANQASVGFKTAGPTPGY